MDVVITYVNGLDPLWQKDYEYAVGKTVIAKRFRDWGTLKYLLRGVEEHLPFVENVFLVVARESQVPSWLNRSRIRVVLHGEIIPEEFLPVFNSSSIEMFLHRIPGLGEHVLYLNDDFFPMRDCGEDVFFPGGKPVIGMARQFFVIGNDFRYLVRKSDRLARKAAGRPWSPFYLRPQHICYAMLKSRCEEAFEASREAIMASVTRLRERSNYNVYYFLDYIHYRGDSVNRRLSKKHFSLAVADLDEICAFIGKPSCDFVCINDVQMTDEKFNRYRTGICEAFERVLPAKSSYEL